MTATDPGSLYDLVIIGSGAAAFAGAIKAADLGKRVAMIEQGVLGGTCVNVGCVPSKTLIRAAEEAHRAGHPRFRGITTGPPTIDFPALVMEKDRLVAGLRHKKYRQVLESLDSVELIEAPARFISEGAIEAAGRIISADRFLIATGARPHVPPLPGLADLDYLTSTSAFEITRLPASLLVLGGRAIALELAQMFQRLGVRVTVLQRSDRILPLEDPDLTSTLTSLLEEEGIQVLTGVTVHTVGRDDLFRIDCSRNGKRERLAAEQLLVATGRVPDTRGLAPEKAGVAVGPDGSIQTDEYGQTTNARIYAAGDVTGGPAFVYTAAYEGRLAVENALSGRGRRRDYSVLPYVIFTDPQVARVGMNERQAREEGLEVEAARLDLADLPRALAARDTRGFVKLLKKRGADSLIGASILAPEGGELLMEVSLAIRHGIPVSDLAAMFHPYLTLSEAVKLAAQSFGRDVRTLSCCAS